MIEVVGMLVVAQEHGIGSTEGLGGERRGAHFVSVVCASWYWPGGSKVGSVRTRKPEASKRAVGPPVSVIRNVAVGRRHRLSPSLTDEARSRDRSIAMTIA